MWIYRYFPAVSKMISQNHKTCSVSKFQHPNWLEWLLKKVQAKKVTTYVLINSLYNTPYNTTSYNIYVNNGLTTSLSMLQSVIKIYMTIGTIQYYNRFNIVHCFLITALIINNQRHIRSINQYIGNQYMTPTNVRLWQIK